jgi:arginyl-tRNA synthetase
MDIAIQIKERVKQALVSLYGAEVKHEDIQVQRTRRDFAGDYTVVVFPFLRYSRRSPEQTAETLGNFLKDQMEEIGAFNVIKGFLNLVVEPLYWVRFLNEIHQQDSPQDLYHKPNKKTIVVEYSSPNTNKPLHLGHIRNNLLGYSISRILEAAGNDIRKVNLVNDRGIHICKSMLAWQKWGNGITPEKSGKKGDHLVGEYYVQFDKAYKQQVQELMAEGLSKAQAEKEAPLIKEAQEMLHKWENDDPETVQLWKIMNSWVLEGFDKTYDALGVDFHKIYYESEVYKTGKEEVLKGVQKGVFEKDPDGSVWADFSDQGLDRKLLLRKDSTSVYITQDIGTAIQRFHEYRFDHHIYVVGNEQNYHFQVLKLLLERLGYDWAGNLYHLAYGMVELPEGKMKSREGTVVDADDLIAEMIQTAETISRDSGKIGDYSDEEKAKIYRAIGLGALKYFILKVDPKKNMTFDPQESVDFNGHTGPFIQYSYARINSLLDKAREKDVAIPARLMENDASFNDKEIQLIKLIHHFPREIFESAEQMDPSIIANFVYELAREFNQFYHEYSVLRAESPAKIEFRLLLSIQVSRVIREAMWLLGIDLPERM